MTEKITFGYMSRGQYPLGDDMALRFDELLEQARTAETAGYDCYIKSSHYSGYPLMELQQMPLLSRLSAEFSAADDDVLITAMETLMAHVGKEGVTAPIHDHIKGRKCEMSFINGLVARKGKECDIPVTHNASVAEIDQRINEREIAMDPSNFGLLKSMVDSIPNQV